VVGCSGAFLPPQFFFPGFAVKFKDQIPDPEDAMSGGE
jgi:hypothetical protein